MTLLHVYVLVMIIEVVGGVGGGGAVRNNAAKSDSADTEELCALQQLGFD